MLEINFLPHLTEYALGYKNMIETKKNPMARFSSLPRDRSHTCHGPRTQIFSKISNMSEHSHVIYRLKRNFMLVEKNIISGVKNMM